MVSKISHGKYVTEFPWFIFEPWEICYRINHGKYVTEFLNFIYNIAYIIYIQMVRVHGYRSRSPGSVLGATRFSESWVWNWVNSTS
jgi:hypothetical protein